MNKFGLVKNGIVQSSFYDARSLDDVKLAYPDIAPYLMELSAEVCDNWTYSGGIFAQAAAPVVVSDSVDPAYSLMMEG